MAGSMLSELEVGWLLLSNFSVDARNRAKKSGPVAWPEFAAGATKMKCWSYLIRQFRISDRGAFGVTCRSSSARVQPLLQCMSKASFLPHALARLIHILVELSCFVVAKFLLHDCSKVIHFGSARCRYFRVKENSAAWSANKFRIKNETCTSKHSEIMHTMHVFWTEQSATCRQLILLVSGKVSEIVIVIQR